LYVASAGGRIARLPASYMYAAELLEAIDAGFAVPAWNDLDFYTADAVRDLAKASNAAASELQKKSGHAR
jgi:hypothetical protein